MTGVLGKRGYDQVQQCNTDVQEEPEVFFTDTEEEFDAEAAEKAFMSICQAEESTVQSDNEINVDVSEETKNVDSSEAPPIKKRDKKVRERHVCTGCGNQFKKLVDGKIGLCYACVWIYESVQAQVRKNSGSVEILHDEADTAWFVLTCNRGHEWEAKFAARQGHKWCKKCPGVNRKIARELKKKEMAKEQAKIAEKQNEMFEQARMKMFGQVEETVSFEEDQIKQIVQQIVAGEFHPDQASQFNLVELVIQSTKEQLQSAIEGQLKVLRRITFLVHPDKCAHAQAKEAFQKVSQLKEDIRS